MKFHTTAQLGPKQSVTPEGFLVCHDVAITRVGEWAYRAQELPGLKAGPDGVVRTTRDEADVFAEATVSSFLGKPITVNHPRQGKVDPTNWRSLAVGTVQNVRRGTEDEADLLLADLLFTEDSAIRAVRGGVRQVSCGYEAEYLPTDMEGRYKQANIIGNHVALVVAGRAGPRCSIGDEDMTKPWADRVKDLFRSRPDGAQPDESALDALLSEANGGVPVVHIHNASGAPQRTADAPATTLDDIKTLLTGLNDRVEKLERPASSPQTPLAPGAVVTFDKATTPSPEPEEAAGDNGAGLVKAMTETRSRAEVLSPGLSVPTFDGQVEVSKVRETIHDVRVRAIEAAYGTAVGKKAIDAVTGLTAMPDVKKMTVDSVRLLFSAAAEIARTANNSVSFRASGSTPLTEFRKDTTQSPADINKANREFWSKRHGVAAV